MKKLVLFFVSALVLASCASTEEESSEAAPVAEKAAEPNVHLTTEEKEKMVATLTARLAGRPLLRDTDAYSGLMYVQLINVNDTKQEELYMLYKTATGYEEEVLGLKDGEVVSLYSGALDSAKAQRSLVMRNDHYFLASTVAYEKGNDTIRKITYSHVGADQKLVMDEGLLLQTVTGADTLTNKSKNLVTKQMPTIQQYQAMVHSYKVKQQIVANDAGVISMNVPYIEAKNTLNDVYRTLTGKNYVVTNPIEPMSDEERMDLQAQIAALSLFHEDRRFGQLTDRELSEFVAKDVVHGALRFFDTQFTDVAQSTKSLEGYTYVGYNRSDLNVYMQKLFHQTPTYENVQLDGSKLPYDLIATEEYVYLPQLTHLPKAKIPIIQQLSLLQNDQLYVELAFVELHKNPKGYTEDTFFASVKNWSSDMHAAIRYSEPKRGYALVQKIDGAYAIQKLVFNDVLNFEQQRAQTK